ncbi:uncharacterized protein F5147DRAFT_813187 [Suillus discolor]|uniref:SET domain-containing protein n=1 Tax=Suillus discolor TaxID=1912936 RepID=A0A9P7EQV2_9AGAM|nr:uncharacterized protein F5147DRAFT_813187 [Suillus discolor]KAG2080360.1 hypothetical protein F5147DRAFT_813187 [Suillus discolor]
MEPSSAAELRRWLTSTAYGGLIYPSVSLSQAKFGLSAIAQDAIDADTTIVSCPCLLAIDVECSLHALTALFGELTLVDLQSWSERQLICTDLCLHCIFPDSSQIPDALRYLRNTCRTFIHAVNPDWAERYTWDKYSRASTCLSTRAFPSTLLSRSPTLQTTSSSYPFILPRVDILNHSRGQPVSWCTSYPEGITKERDESTTISIISHATTPLGEDVFNNYGLNERRADPRIWFFAATKLG